ncbi:hypothetical protein BTVI_55946 [Pitangus sulphuratus]|nr:hypothetical protein BTVI_55946 [Pitangus sulphuratus]
MLEQFMKNCSTGEELTLEKFMEDCLLWEGTPCWSRGIRGPPPEEEGLAEAICDELTTDSTPLSLKGGGGVSRLQRFFEIFFKNSSPQQAFNNMKEAISKLLLVTEVFSESSASGPNSFNQCSQCFQMLTFDIGFSMSIYPVVLEVHENFDFQDEDESTIQDQTFKELIFEDTFKFLLSNQSSTSTFIEALQKIYGSTASKDGKYHRDEQCFSLEEINSMITFIKELKSLGQFELLFPSAAPKIQTFLRDLYRMVDPMRRLGSVLTVHWLLSSLLEQFQFMNKEAHTNISEWLSSQENKSLKQNVPSDSRKSHKDKDTLSHIRQIFTSPQLDLNPQFNPKIKEYYAEVPFDMVTVKIGAEPSNCQCQVHLDDKKGPSNANYPLGLGLNKVIILVTDDSQPSPQVVSSYKITVYREDRPSLPLFDDYMMCGFVQSPDSIRSPAELIMRYWHSIANWITPNGCNAAGNNMPATTYTLTQPVVLQGVVVAKVQDPALGLVEPFGISPTLQSVQVPLQSPPAFQLIDTPLQLGVISKFTNGGLNPLV